MKPIAILNDTFKDYLYVNFISSTVCNYSCHYCFPGCNDGKYRWPNDLELFKKNLGHMLDVYRENLGKTKIRLNIAGGEPTLWPQLGEFAEHFHKEYGCKITLATNGSRTMRFWKEYAKYFDDICIAAHHESCDLNHIKEVLDYVYNNTDVLINCLVLMDTKDWTKCENIVKELQDHPTPWLLKVRPLKIDGKIIDYTEEQKLYIKDKMKKMPPKEWIQKMRDLNKLDTEEDKVGMQLLMDNGELIDSDTNMVFRNNWYQFTGWECNIGVDRFQINADGSIVGSCDARNLYNLREPLNVYDENFIEEFNKVDIVPVKCRQVSCLCSAEIKMPKRKHV